MDSDTADRHLGEYELRERVGGGELSDCWLAEQVSVRRPVLIDVLRADRADRREEFLADVRAKAAVDHPLVGSVYEAVDDDLECFYAHELLPGASFEERRRAGERFQPVRLAHYLRRVSEANLHLEGRGQSAAELGLESILLDEQGVVRLRNLVVAGVRGDGESARDVVRLGGLLRELVAEGQPGATRMTTVLSWMRGEGVARPIKWKEVRDFCEQIEQQLAEPLPPVISAGGAGTGLAPGRGLGAKKLTLLGIGGLLVIVLLALKMRPEKEEDLVPVALPEPVTIAEGVHPTPDGTAERLRAFRMAAHEVTIAQYAEFLGTLKVLAKDGRQGIFDHESQPAGKSGHVPDDWSALHGAANARGQWQGRALTPDSPVVGVDWWDAAAYAEWKQARLPSQEEWFAAVSQGLADVSSLKPGPWQPVTMATPDRTPNGLLGMAGSVSEWTRRPAANPNNPLGQRLWVIIGGSFLNPGGGALAREWTEDRGLRRPDLGFRLVYDAGGD